MGTLPHDKQAKRMFHGMLPEYYHKVSFSYPSPDTEMLTFYFYSYRTSTNEIAAIIQVTYTDGTKSDLLDVDRIFYNETIHL